MKLGKKIVLLLTAVLLIMLVLSGCGCEHQWREATCESAKVCDRCGVTEGEPNGHDLTEATLTEAPTCTVCGITPTGALSLTAEKLVGKWQTCGMISDGGFASVSGTTGYCEFEADGSGKVGGISSEFDCIWSFVQEGEQGYLYSFGSVFGAIYLGEGLFQDMLLIMFDGDAMCFQKVE